MDSDRPGGNPGSQRLKGLDGAFLAFESPTTHLHIAGVLVFDPTGVPGGVGFRQIRDMVAARVSRVPPFRRRMVGVPFGLQHPTMVDDPDFDVDFHVRRVSLPQPGGHGELATLVGDIVERPLDRDRPLWEFHVVEGLDHGHVAVVTKIHHAIIDGVSGAEIMAAFFDLSARPEDPVTGTVPPPADGGEARTEEGSEDGAEVWAPEPVPGDVEQLRGALGSLPGQTDSVARTLGATARTVRNLTGRNRQVEGTAPPLLFQAPRTSINRAISSHRRVAFAELTMDDIRRVRGVLGGSVNDVVLASVSGAMRAFFARRGETLESSLVAMVPISVRSEAERGALGNRVSATLVSLATGVEDPAARLKVIAAGMHQAKQQQETVGSELFSNWAQALFPMVSTRVSRLVTNLRLFDHLPPVFNLVVSNIPGPDVPLFMAGARMVAIYPIGPVAEGVGVNVTVFSYLGTVYIGVQGCWDLVPDVDVIANGMVDALGDLVKESNRRSRKVPWWHSDLPR
ncbi:MAG TPA: wax ester/triacylglycerol synthase family O-acyltransferase [Acidimicrobiales bacterium]|nr:wax ester/triacylglycerol synthase family O-acyltransferase [Acidimicrobiales bacterium]